MNSKNMAKHLSRKLKDWVQSIDDPVVAKVVRDNAIVTGGALVSLLTGEPPNDYDIYFKTFESCLVVADYYAKKWNEMYPNKPQVTINHDEDKRITAFIESVGVVLEDGEDGIDDESEPVYTDDDEPDVQEVDDRPKYRPRYFSTNAISLSDKIQLVIRFYGSVEEIHTNYDFVHCTCSYDFKENKVDLPSRALEAIITKELYYMGSKYPLCSIIRSRKFIQRGWFINAGQYLKMCLQLNELDLKDLDVFEDQLAGVDSYYFNQAIKAIKKEQESNPDFTIDNTYLFEIINRIF
ncbi:MAG: hypothetical protein GX181_10645 [Synergistaceae bacterium]|nr:hypothetical protein [Synergistaceae bacterium]